MNVIEGQDVFECLFLTESLTAALQHPRCTCLSSIDEGFEKLCHLSWSGDEDESPYWIDDVGERMCMAFPAILDMNGVYGRYEPYFSLVDKKSVSVFF
jgi:hypothetical protein